MIISICSLCRREWISEISVIMDEHKLQFWKKLISIYVWERFTQIPFLLSWKIYTLLRCTKLGDDDDNFSLLVSRTISDGWSRKNLMRIHFSEGLREQERHTNLHEIITSRKLKWSRRVLSVCYFKFPILQ